MNSSDSITILDLPIEIYHLIFDDLDALSLLHFTATCKTLHIPALTHDAHYWSNIVRSTFRVPNQPVVENHGRRWRRLYQRLATQTRTYTWGNNEKGCLGRDAWTLPDATVYDGADRGSIRNDVFGSNYSGIPGQMRGRDDLGVVADLQCGGWSTTLLTAKGSIYVAGILGGRDPYQRIPLAGTLKRLRYPPGYASPHERYEPTTAVEQFSTGRQHVLALADSGRIWSWFDADRPGQVIDLTSCDVVESRDRRRTRSVRKVVAGWNKSAALINDVGIVVWSPISRELVGDDMRDILPITRRAVVPNTNERRTKSILDSSLPETAIGEVCNFVLLDSSIIFNTHLGKVFQSKFEDWSSDEPQLSMPMEVYLPEHTSLTPDERFVTDVQGSFQSFAFFTESGAVWLSNENRLITDEPFTIYPALQNSGVISLAFGDWHLHALHSTGHITSYGREPGQFGAFGLGSMKEAQLRGVRKTRRSGDATLVHHAYDLGRRIWFEPEKRAWLRFMAEGGSDPEEASDRVALTLHNPSEMIQGEVSEWVEHETRRWDEKYNIDEPDQDGAGAYFALSVAAAGWHSGALVLVDDVLAKKRRVAVEISDNPKVQNSTQDGLRPDVKYVWANEHFPRLRLSDGSEMPGTVPLSD